jgi:repressor LexA
MLTHKQLNLLKFINDRIELVGVSPSFDEMREALDLKSKSGIHRLISALEERGFIRRLAHRARALEVLKLPDYQIKRNEISYLNIQNKINDNQIPLMGKIAAGTPIEAIQDPYNNIDVPNAMLGKGNHYALEVNGESMINDGINNGDIVLIREQKQAVNGQIVVALINDEEATLKRFYKKGSKIELEASNPEFSTQEFSEDQVQIQGLLIGLLRTY